MKATKEAWFLQRSPKGSVIIVYFEAADPANGMEAFGKSKNPSTTIL